MLFKPKYSLSTLFDITQDVQKQGGIIGFTHGTFDLFHEGHLDLLQKSSKLCDILLVAVEQDKTVERYKRLPIIPENIRANIINNINAVYASFVMPLSTFNDKERSGLYKDLKINKFFVGPNFYDIRTVRDRVVSAGANFYQINSHKHSTTTDLIERIIDRHNINHKDK
jgi:cytidyltransferase-like protein